jgi:hypothetical protein
VVVERVSLCNQLPKKKKMAYTEEELKKELETKEYEYGFYTDIESDTFPIGLSEEIVVAISKKKRRTRLDDPVAFRRLQVMARNGRTGMGERALHQARFSGHLLLFCAQ